MRHSPRGGRTVARPHLRRRPAPRAGDGGDVRVVVADPRRHPTETDLRPERLDYVVFYLAVRARPHDARPARPRVPGGSRASAITSSWAATNAPSANPTPAANPYEPLVSSSGGANQASPAATFPATAAAIPARAPRRSATAFSPTHRSTPRPPTSRGSQPQARPRCRSAQTA